MSSAETQLNPVPSSKTYKWDWFAAILLLVMLQSVSGRLVATEWVNNIEIMLALSLLGGIAGLALGISNFSSFGVIFFSFAYGLFSVLWQLGLILGQGVQWLERLISLWGRLSISVESLVNQENVKDPLLFLTIVSIIVWVISVYTGISLVRKNRSWRVVLPGGVAIMIINAYSYQDDVSARFLAFYVFIILLLVARLYFLERRVIWERIRVTVPFHISFDLIVGAILFSGFLVILAWNTPAAVAKFTSAEEAWEGIIAPFKEATERLDNAFAALKSSVGLVAVGGVRGYYGDDIPLGLGIPQTDDLIFSIDVPKSPTEEIRYYWRARNYDSYQGGRWTNTKIDTQLARPDEFEVSFPVYDAQWEAVVEITTHIPLSTLYAPPEPRWVSRPVELEINPAQEDIFELVAMHATPPLMAGEVYEVQVSRSDVTITELKNAGIDYPDWIKKKYLQVPESVTEKTLNLAEHITRNATTPFDKVTAVTEFLRDNIEYVDTIPEPPEDVEPIEWMLFDSHLGFCNYYATAEVILLRSLGIPARFSVGYSQGELSLEAIERPALGGNLGENPGDFMETTGDQITYLVRAKNLHSWPEVYFPEYGWIEFEPTVNQLPLVRPFDETTSGNDLTDSDNQTGAEDIFNQENDQLPEPEPNLPEDDFPFIGGSNFPLSSFGVIILTAGSLWIFWWFLRRFRGVSPAPVLLEKRLLQLDIHPPSLLQKWARWSTLSAMERSYHAINRSLFLLGARQDPATSPSERAKKLVTLLPDSSGEIPELLEEYQNWLYGGKLANVKFSKKLARGIKIQAFIERLRHMGSESK